MMKPQSLSVSALLVTLVAFTPMSIDILLPSLTAIAVDLQRPFHDVQLVLSVFLLGFAFSQLIIGPLSDRFGRRPVLIFGLAVYVIASVLCALAQSLDVLVAGRFLQSFGACAAPVLARAIVRDVYGHDRSAQMMSYISAAVAIAPFLAPIIGGYIQTVFDWRASFVFLVIFSALAFFVVVLGLPETNKWKNPEAMAFRRFHGNYGILLCDRAYLGNALCAGGIFFGMFSFISSSGFILMDFMGLGPVSFSYAFAASAASFAVGGLLGGRFSRAVGVDRMIFLACFLALAGGGSMAILAWAGVWTVWAVMVPQVVFMIGGGMVFPLCIGQAIAPHVKRAGSASALIGFIQGMTGAGAAYLVNQLLDGTPRFMALFVALAAVFCLVIFYTMVWRKQRRAEATVS